MKDQVFAFKRGSQLYVDTPAGFVVILWLARGRIQVSVPDCCAASRGLERAAQRKKFLTVDGNSVRPLYSMLVPVMDHEGNLIGAEQPRVLALKG